MTFGMNEVLMKFFFTVVLLCITSAANAGWEYSESTDRMTSKTVTFAKIQSDNSLRLDFPYKGDNFGKIIVRQHPKDGLDVMIKIDKGQILCRSYSGCPVEIRFDDKPAMRFSGTEPADNSSETIFLNNAPRFISEAKKARRVLVSMNIYQSGAPVLEFNSTTPLEWGKKAAVAPKK